MKFRQVGLNKWNIFPIFLALVFSLNTSFADNAEDISSVMYPTHLLKLDNKYNHHVLIAEKSTHKLYIYANDNGTPKFVRAFNVATGKITGDKYVQGDRKTPEGIYSFSKFLPSEKIIKMYGQETGKIYGAGAFVTSYPNLIDRISGKTGGGIWLHSPHDPARVSKGLDSRGCVVVVDQDLKDISRYIELQNTPIIVVQNLSFLHASAWKQKKEDIVQLIENWRNSWQNENLDSYLSAYHKTEFSHPHKGRNFQLFKNYKSRVFSGPGKPDISIEHLSIVTHDGHAFVTFNQAYKSNHIDDVGRKSMILKMDSSYNWKIVHESWHKIPTKEDDRVAFSPSMRFF